MIAALVLLASIPGLGPSADDVDAGAFLSRHCARCHTETKPRGEFRVDNLGRDFDQPRAAGRWAEVMDRISSGEMPPEGEPRPDPRQVAQITDWIAARLAEGEAARHASTGERVSLRRLSREEYRNTIFDLLGVRVDVADPAGLPEDPDWQGFERIGSVLTLSASHVEKYLGVAEAAIEEALPGGPTPRREVVRWSASKLRVREDVAEDLAARGLLDKVRADIVPNNGALDAHDLRIETTGEYIVRARLSGLRPENGRAPRFRIYATDLGRALFERDIDAPEDRPEAIEFRAHLPAGTHLIRLVNAVPGPNPEERASRPLNTKPFLRMSARQPWQIKLTDEDSKPLWPTLLLDYVEWDGPVVEPSPSSIHRRIFFADADRPRDSIYAREILSRFATDAFRRPATTAEVDRLLSTFEQCRARGDAFESAVKTGLLAVLCSKNFLYLVEGSSASTTTTLTDHELASRLSYFLWSTMPDERLRDLAAQGTLHEPETLRGEVCRLMAGPRASAFAESFPRQWLQLRRVGMFPPDKKLYPDYDEYLETSMLAETTGFFREVLRANLSLREFLASDWSMLNGILARHYGVDGVDGEPMRRVALRPGDHRGGLLTQASILGLTSDGTRHRPVHRGKWVLESLYGSPPPPPPPNVAAIPTTPPSRPKTSLRAKIEAHREDNACASCHRKIDPLGLAFEQFDAVGRWRTVEAVREGSGDNPPLDPSGELPDGRKFADADGLKTLMVADLDRFAAATAAKLATYGMRRGLTFDDRRALAAVVEGCKPDGYRLSSLVEALATSELFRKR